MALHLSLSPLCPQAEGFQWLPLCVFTLPLFCRKTKHKQLTVRFQFPEEYPQAPIIIELVSRIMSHKLLDGLSKICEEEAKKLLGQRQVGKPKIDLKYFSLRCLRCWQQT